VRADLHQQFPNPQPTPFVFSICEQDNGGPIGWRVSSSTKSFEYPVVKVGIEIGCLESAQCLLNPITIAGEFDDLPHVCSEGLQSAQVIFSKVIDEAGSPADRRVDANSVHAPADINREDHRKGSLAGMGSDDREGLDFLAIFYELKIRGLKASERISGRVSGEKQGLAGAISIDDNLRHLQ
jgi:hypothetical protein